MPLGVFKVEGRQGPLPPTPTPRVSCHQYVSMWQLNSTFVIYLVALRAGEAVASAAVVAVGIAIA